MRSRHSLLWLGAPTLLAALTVQTATGQQMQQMHQEQMQQASQEKSQQMSSADMQKCAEMHGMDSSKIDMNDAHTQQMMHQCMQMMHEGKMMGGGMTGNQMQGNQMQGNQMKGGQMHGNPN